MTTPLTRIPPGNEQTLTRQGNAIQTNARRAARAVDDRGPPPRVIGPFAFTPGQQRTLDHGLMRVPEECYPVYVTGSYGTFFVIRADDRTVTVQSGNACTAKFRVA